MTNKTKKLVSRIIVILLIISMVAGIIVSFI